MIKRIHKYFFYALLTVVYGVFFSVESFYNFDGHSEAKQLVVRSYTALNASGGVLTSSKPLSKPNTMRLNKRYHQANFPPCPVFRVESPVVYITPRMLGTLPIRPHPQFIPPSSGLRGPPYVA